MHGGRVDLLNHAKPIAVDCRALRRYSSAHVTLIQDANYCV
jgi:hypothetical protein